MNCFNCSGRESLGSRSGLPDLENPLDRLVWYAVLIADDRLVGGGVGHRHDRDTVPVLLGEGNVLGVVSVSSVDVVADDHLEAPLQALLERGQVLGAVFGELGRVEPVVHLLVVKVAVGRVDLTIQSERPAKQLGHGRLSGSLDASHYKDRFGFGILAIAHLYLSLQEQNFLPYLFVKIDLRTV